MRVAPFSVSDLIGNDLFLAPYMTGYESPAYRYRVVQGIPKGSKIVDIKKMDFGYTFLVEHESFPDVEDPMQSSSMTIQTELIK